MRGQAISFAGSDGSLAHRRLTIDLDALASNYHTMARLSGRAKTAAVVKADAYGLGMEPVARALSAAGCDRFFVTWPEEGIACRRTVPGAEIFVLGGILDRHGAAACVEAQLIPALNSTNEIELWASFLKQQGMRKPCAIHVDTGMNRSGLSVQEATIFAHENAGSHAVSPVLLMSHLACADQPDHPKNREQLESFQGVRSRFSGIESSLANSGGIFLGRDYHFDMTRTGIALYGGAPAGLPNPMRPVVTAETRIIQIREAKAGESVSYGATIVLDRDTKIAVAAVGYADGFHRASSGTGVPLRKINPSGGFGFVAGRTVPALGRVTMDITMFDITGFPEGAVKVGDWMELFGPNVDIEHSAIAAGTISYELLTGFGTRYHRRYITDAEI